jgi:hypothetical protein
MIYIINIDTAGVIEMDVESYFEAVANMISISNNIVGIV